MCVLNCARKASITGRTCKHYKETTEYTRFRWATASSLSKCPVIWRLDYWWYFLSPNVKNIALHFPTYWIKGCKWSYGGPYNNGTYLFILKKVHCECYLRYWVSHRQPRPLCFSEPGSQICSANCWFQLVDQRKVFVHCELWMCS